MKKSLKVLLAEYGTVALIVYLVIFVLTLSGFTIAIRMGWQPESATGGIGVLAAAYIATKVTQPFRIMGTLALTPLVARVYERLTARTRPEG